MRLNNRLLEELAALLTERMGIRFSADQGSSLERGIKAAAGDLGFTDLESCVRELLSGPLRREQLEVLASHLTIGETYFFREPAAFDVLESKILEPIVTRRKTGNRRLRIWSAGCASGEEPYSLAMLLHRMVPDLHRWNVTILATDINRHFLERAKLGVYREWSFRGSQPELRSRFFQDAGNKCWRIRPEIQSMVRFSCLNLVEDNYPALVNWTNAMDLIVCRNVLMYFTATAARSTVEKFRRALVDDGYLVVGAVETSPVLYDPLQPVNFDGVTVYSKRRCKTAPQEPSVHLWAPEFEPESLAPAVGLLSQPAPNFSEPKEAEPASAVSEPIEQPESVLLKEAWDLFEKGNYLEAEARARALTGGEACGHGRALLLARICANQGRLDEGVEWCRQALQLDKLCAAGHLLMANIEQEQGNPEEAYRYLKRALYLEPASVVAHFALGSLAGMLGRRAQSQKHFSNAEDLLDGYDVDEVLPGSEGMSAGRMRGLISLLKGREMAA